MWIGCDDRHLSLILLMGRPVVVVVAAVVVVVVAVVVVVQGMLWHEFFKQRWPAANEVIEGCGMFSVFAGLQF